MPHSPFHQVTLKAVTHNPQPSTVLRREIVAQSHTFTFMAA